MPTVTMDHLLSVIGAKEVEIQLLKTENTKLANEVEQLKNGHKTRKTHKS